jgi:hypothetical protein
VTLGLNSIEPDTPRNVVLLMILNSESELRKRRLKQNESLVNDKHDEDVLLESEQSCFND